MPKNRRATDRSWVVLPAVFLWTLVVQLAFIVGDPARSETGGILFRGEADAIHAEAQLLVREGWRELPRLRAPVVPALLVPFRALLPSPRAVHLGAKALMAGCSGLTFALLYILLRERWPRLAAPIACLLPLGFGELVACTAPSREIPYRLLLLGLVALGWRRPVLAGGLHAAAALTFPAHLPLAAVAAAVLLWLRPDRRARIALTVAVAAILLAPWAVLRSRAPGGGPKSLTAELGLASSPEPIAFQDRLATAADTLSAGWSWRNLPPGGTFRRAPGDLSVSHGNAYRVVLLVLVALGAWHLRRDSELFLFGGLLLLAFGALGLLAPPVGRHLLIPSPFVGLLVLQGLATLAGSFAPRALLGLLALLAFLHLPTAPRTRDYLVRRTDEGVTTLIYRGHVARR